MALLSIKELSVSFQSGKSDHQVIKSVSFDVKKGETLGIVGESGCGKSVTSLAVMGLIPSPPGRVTHGEILFDGVDLLGLSGDEMRDIRGNDISMIFQEPMTSLNPVFTIGNQIVEAIRAHRKISKAEAHERAVEMLRLVGITAPEQNMKSYPHQLSGGMRQRVMIAMALSCEPKLLIADEPTTALDVTIQAQVLELMRDLRKNLDTSIVLITHDLGVVAEMVERVIVMYAGSIVEEAPVGELFHGHRHPYTEGLLGSIPRIDEIRDRLYTIQGSVPHPSLGPSGCYFHPRCPYVMDICRQEAPRLRPVGENHTISCHKE